MQSVLVDLAPVPELDRGQIQLRVQHLPAVAAPSQQQCTAPRRCTECPPAHSPWAPRRRPGSAANQRDDCACITRTRSSSSLATKSAILVSLRMTGQVSLGLHTRHHAPDHPPAALAQFAQRFGASGNGLTSKLIFCGALCLSPSGAAWLTVSLCRAKQALALLVSALTMPGGKWVVRFSTGSTSCAAECATSRSDMPSERSGRCSCGARP